MYSNMKYYENICNCLRVIQQNINRKLKSANCWQRTSLNRSVHEGKNDILKVKVHLRTYSGNVNIQRLFKRVYPGHISIQKLFKV